MKDRIIMILILSSMIVLILVGCIKPKVNYNEYQEHFIDSLLFKEKKEFELPEIEIEEVEDEEEKEFELIYLGQFKLTGYCDCEICQGPWSGTTALGVPPTINHTIAVDPEVIPLGTHVVINGIEYVAEDTGSAIIGNRIDIFCSTHEECYNDFCNGIKDVYEIKRP